MLSKLSSLITHYEEQIELAEEKLSSNQISQDKYDFIHFTYPKIVEQYKNILQHLQEKNCAKALEILESLTIPPTEKNHILEIINFSQENTKKTFLEVPHEINIIASLENFIKINEITYHMEWDEIARYAIDFYESRLAYELNPNHQEQAFKSIPPDNITALINNNISLLYNISNTMNSSSITQNNINDLTRDINHLSHYVLRKIFIDKYKICNYTSTGYHHLLENEPTINSQPETINWPDNSLPEDAALIKKLKDSYTSIIQPPNIPNSASYEMDVSAHNKQIQEIFVSELQKSSDSNKKNIQSYIDNIVDEISSQLTNNYKNSQEIINQIQLHVNSALSDLAQDIAKLGSLLYKNSLTPENNPYQNSEDINKLSTALDSFQKTIPSLFTQYLDETIIKQGNNTYEAAQVLEYNIRALSEDIIKIEDQMRSTNSLMEETKKFLSFKSFKYHLNTILWSSTLMVALIGWIFIWVGMQINSGELSQLRYLKYKFANTCKIINSQEPKLKQNLIEKLNIDCSTAQ
ncbi:MAG: hypothetical protein KBD37_00070 [Burkholderiales bacterium]|nr:hypothetical protein [Burkholderiales bacterium]